MGVIGTSVKTHVVEPLSAFEVRGETFLVLKKESLDELLILMQSVAEGDRLVKARRTRSFSEFVRSIQGKSR